MTRTFAEEVREVARLRLEIAEPVRGALWGDFHTYIRKWDDERADRCAKAYGLTLAHVRAERTWWLMNGKPEMPARLALPGTLQGEVSPATSEPRAADASKRVEPAPSVAKQRVGTRKVGRPPKNEARWPSDEELLAEDARRRSDHGVNWAQVWAAELGVKRQDLYDRLKAARRRLAEKGGIMPALTATSVENDPTERVPGLVTDRADQTEESCHVADQKVEVPAFVADAEVKIPIDQWKGQALVEVIQHMERMLGGPVLVTIEPGLSRFVRGA